MNIIKIFWNKIFGKKKPIIQGDPIKEGWYFVNFDNGFEWLMAWKNENWHISQLFFNEKIEKKIIGHKIIGWKFVNDFQTQRILK
jgi:hypothetical protein